MSKLATLQNLAKSRYNPSQPRDSDGKWTSGGGKLAKVRQIAGNAAAKGLVVGAGIAGHHAAGEAGAVAAMVATRAAITVVKGAVENRKADSLLDTLDEIEEQAQGDVIGHFIAGAMRQAVGVAADAVVPHGGQIAGMAASAAITPQLVKAAKILKGKMQAEPATAILRTT